MVGIFQNGVESLEPGFCGSVKRELIPCRICLCEDVGNLANPIISPCKCSGSMGCVHLECLRTWIKQRVTIHTSDHVQSFHWKSLHCEVCKTPYPFAVYFDGKVYELLNIKPPHPPFFVVESYKRHADFSNGIHIISLHDKKILRIGRNSDVEWRIKDISISRNHASIIKHGKDLYLQDKGSKFGTIKLLVGKHKMGLDNKLVIQCGKTLLRMVVEKPWSLRSLFGGNKTTATKVEQEEQKDAPESPLLPSNGAHNILVVNKKKYQKLLRIEDRKRREKQCGLQVIPEDGALPRSKIVHPQKFFPNLLSKCGVGVEDCEYSPIAHAAHLEDRRATAIFQMSKVFAGDTADDVAAEETP